MNGYLIGIDSGTTATKVILFNTKGEIIGSSYFSYPLNIRNADIIEQNPEDWWNALVKGVKYVSRKVKNKERIKAISISTQGATLIPLDRNKKLLSPAITWLDKRAKKESDELATRFGQEYFFKRTGHKMQDYYPLAKIIKWKKEPNFYRRIFKIAQVNDYLIYRLTGKLIADPSNAAMSLMFNLKKNDWDSELLDAVGINKDVLAPIKPSGISLGNLSASTQKELGLSKNTLVINGGHDQYSAALGAGVISEGDCLLSCGTAWAVVCPTNKQIFDPLMRISAGVSVTDNKYGLMGVISNGNIVFDRMRSIIGIKDGMLQDNRTEKEIDKRIKKNNLIFLPHFLKNSGAFIGLNLSTDKYDLLLAMMEGLTFETRIIMERLKSFSINPQRIMMVGGAVKSNIWPKIVANVLRKDIVTLKFPEAACRGAAMLAGLGSGIFKNSQEACKNMVKKEKMIKPELKDNYGKSFIDYKKLSKTVLGISEK